MLLLELCFFKHVLALLVPGHACGFTILQHPVLQQPLLCILLDHIWVLLGKQWYLYIYICNGLNCIFGSYFFIWHFWQNNCVKISSVSLERTQEKCISYVVNPVVDPRNVSQIEVFELYFILPGLLQEYPRTFSVYPQQLYYCCEFWFSLPPPLFYVESDQEIFWYTTEHLCVCVFGGGRWRERGFEFSGMLLYPVDTGPHWQK